MVKRWRAYLKGRALLAALVVVAVFAIAPAAAQAVVPTTSIQGYVLDGDTGGPVANADVGFAYYDEGLDEYYESWTSTDSDGFYYANVSNASSEYDVMVMADGYQEYWDWASVNLFTSNTLPTIYLDRIVPTVEGDVTIESTGDPLQWVSVGAYEYYAGEMEWLDIGWADADDTGHWMMDVPSGVYRFEFNSWDPAYSSEWYDDADGIETAQNVTVQSNNVVSGIDAVLSDSVRSITGAIYDPDMALGVSGADVILLKWIDDPDGGWWDWYEWTMTDEYGEYVFYDVEPGETYSLFTPASWLASYWADTYYGDTATESDADSFVYGGGLLTGKDINIQWSEQSFWGYVLDAGTFSAVPGAYLELWRSFDDGASWEWWSATQADWDGYYEFTNVADGLYAIGQSGSIPQMDPDYGEPLGWWMPQYYSGSDSLDSATWLTLPDMSGEQCDLYLTPAPPAAAGSVTRSTGAHEGVEGLEVSLFSYVESDDAWETIAWDITDGAGDFSIFGAAPGDYKLGTWGGAPMVEFPLDAMYGSAYWEGETDIDSADILTIDEDWSTTQAGFNLVVDPVAPVAVGVLKNTHGDFIGDGYVEALAQGYWEEGSSWDSVMETWSGENGTFSLYAYPWQELPHDFVLSFDGGFDYFKEYYNNKRTPAEATPVTLTRGSTVNLGNVILDDYVSKSSRLSGQSRYATAISIAERMTNNYENVNDIILASGENKGAADPLAAAGLTWAYQGAPMVLSLSTAVPQETKDAVKQIVAMNGEVRLHVVGGKLAMPDARITELKNYLGTDADLLVTPLEDPTLRIAGANRFATAAAISDEMRAARPDAPDMVLIANGAEENKFVDALALSTIAAHKGMPILTVSRTSVPQATADQLDKLGIDPENIYVAGGPNTVDPVVLEELGVNDDDWYNGGNRLAGGNRYTTATTIADWAISNGWLNENVCGIAASVPDALTGGAAVGWKGGPLLLTTRDYLWSDTADYLEMLAPSLAEGADSPSNCYVFGGPNSISAGTLAEIDYILSNWDVGFE